MTPSLEDACATAPYGLCVMDRNLVVCYANEQACRLLNTAQERLIGTGISDVLPHLPEAIRSGLSRTVRDGKVSEVREFPAAIPGREAEGALYWNATSSPILAADHSVIGVLAHFFEVTAQVRARQAEAARSSELNAVIETITDGLAIINAEGGIVRINPAGEKILRRPAPDYLPLQNASDYYAIREIETGAVIPPDALPAARALQGETVLGFEQLIRDGTGADIIVVSNASPLRDPGTNAVNGAVVVFRDITQIKRLQAQTAAAYARSRRIARALQESLLPDIPPTFDEHTMSFAFEPAWIEEADVGGDLFDVFFSTENRVHFVMADVSGKGLMAARRTALIKYTVKALACAGHGPQAVVGQLNDALEQDGAFDGFVTLFYGVFDRQDHSLQYVNAGHEPGLLWQSARQRLVLLGTTGLPLGVLGRRDGARWRVRRTRLTPQDALLVYTDGLTEAADLGHGKRLFGDEGAQRLFRESLHFPDAQAGVGHILRGVHDYAGPRLRDDIAVLLMRGKRVSSPPLG